MIFYTLKLTVLEPKPVTAMVIAGIVAVSKGKVAFDGEDIAGRPAYAIVRKGLALSPEGWRLFTQQSVENNLLLGATPLSDPSFDYFANPAAVLREPPLIELAKVVRRREWNTGRSGGGWVVNGKTFSPYMADSQAYVQRNSAELWTFTNGSGGWVHPMHLHLEECRQLTRNGAPVPIQDRGRKDVIHLGVGESVKTFIQFRDFPDPDFAPPNPAYKPEAGRYVVH